MKNNIFSKSYEVQAAKIAPSFGVKVSINAKHGDSTYTFFSKTLNIPVTGSKTVKDVKDQVKAGMKSLLGYALADETVMIGATAGTDSQKIDPSHSISYTVTASMQNSQRTNPEVTFASKVAAANMVPPGHRWGK